MSSESTKISIIADCGLNHNGNLQTAKALMDAAKEAGADFVSFRGLKGAMAGSHWAMLFNHSKVVQMALITNPYDPFSIELLDRVGVKTWKLYLEEKMNENFLNTVAEKKRNLLLTLSETEEAKIEATVKTLCQAGNYKITFLLRINGGSLEPLKKLKRESSFPVGCSFSTFESGLISEAIHLGCRLIEVPLSLVDQIRQLKIK